MRTLGITVGLMFVAGSAAVGQSSTTGTDSTDRGSLRGTPCVAMPTQRSQIFLPPLPPSKLHVKQFTVRLFVNVTGHADTINIVGISDSAYIAKVREEVAKWQLRPKSENGCAVSSWMELSFTF